MHIDDEKDETKVDETKVDETDFGGGFEAADAKGTDDEFTDKPVDKPTDDKPTEAKTTVTVVTEKPTKTEAKPKEPEKTVVEEPEGDATDFLTDDENKELVEAEKKHPGISKIIQRTKSWAGRLKKAHTDLTEAQTLLAQRETDDDSSEEEVVEKVAETIKTAALSEEEQQTVDELATEYPVINKAIDIKARQAAEVIVQKALDERLKPVEDAQQARDRASSESHFREIANSHTDFYELASGGAVDDWIDTLPHLEAKKLLETRKEGSTQEVIALLNRFKAESGYQTPVSETKETTETKGNGKDKDTKPKVTEATKAKRTAALAASEAVPRHSGGPPAADPDDSDFDGGFAQASRRTDE